MKWPRLVREADSRTEAVVTIKSNDPNSRGKYEVLFQDNLNCNLTIEAKRILTRDKRTVDIQAVALFNGDILPGHEPIVNGTLTAHGIEYSIHEGTKARNPDGTVNYTRLVLC